jgi:hypothetical protein
MGGGLPPGTAPARARPRRRALTGLAASPGGQHQSRRLPLRPTGTIGLPDRSSGPLRGTAPILTVVYLATLNQNVVHRAIQTFWCLDGVEAGSRARPGDRGRNPARRGVGTCRHRGCPGDQDIPRVGANHAFYRSCSIETSRTTTAKWRLSTLAASSLASTRSYTVACATSANNLRSGCPVGRL